MTRIESGLYAGCMENLLCILLRGRVTNDSQAVILVVSSIVMDIEWYFTTSYCMRVGKKLNGTTQQMRPFTTLVNHHRTLIAIDIIEYIQGRQREEKLTINKKNANESLGRTTRQSTRQTCNNNWPPYYKKESHDNGSPKFGDTMYWHDRRVDRTLHDKIGTIHI